MKRFAPLISLGLLLAMLSGNFVPVRACGLSYIEPVFVLNSTPEVPFDGYVSGNIGIIKPAFGDKALFVAYRYINNNGFSADEQKGLLEALKGTPPEDDSDDQAVKTWIEARKQVVKEEKLPEIYTEKRWEGYNFFPNCTKNAFEVATATLNNRIGSHGAENRFVQEWLKGQDAVFQICSSGSEFPAALGAESPDWLRKDRDYQIAAAHFYSLNFEEARQRFEAIAADYESDWQTTADYLVARTLVREASLTENKEKSREIYEQAEQYLQSLIHRSGKFQGASLRLQGLVKYRLRPTERVRELAQLLAYQGGNDNLRQDLIDYTWLLDKFEDEVLREEEKRREAVEEAENKQKAATTNANTSVNANSENTNLSALEAAVIASEQSRGVKRRNAIEKGEIITVYFRYSTSPTNPDIFSGSFTTIDFQPDVADEEVFEKFEKGLNRKLTAEEKEKIRQSKKESLAQRNQYLSPNYKIGQSNSNLYEGGFTDEQMPFALIPEYLRSDDLTDWVLTFQSEDPQAFAYSFKRWRETDSLVWLAAALAKADKTSPDLARLLEDAEKVSRDSAVFPTVAYYRANLLLKLGKTAEARKLLDGVLSSGLNLPVSARNQFLQLRLPLSETLAEFLKFAVRQPFAFDNDGFYHRSIEETIKEEKSRWNDEYHKTTKAEWDAEVEARYRTAKLWAQGAMFDEQTFDIINRRFPLEVLQTAARNPDLPPFFRQQFVTAIWTRAALLKDEKTALAIASELAKLQPEVREHLDLYAKARTPAEREAAELWLFLKNPTLTPFVNNGIGRRYTPEADAYEQNWWEMPSDTEYNDKYELVPKTVETPAFLTTEQTEAAKKELEQIAALGDAEEYLSKRVLAWAARAPKDPRVPEALYIVVNINTMNKYFGGSEELKEKAVKLLTSRYPGNTWTNKLSEPQY